MRQATSHELTAARDCAAYTSVLIGGRRLSMAAYWGLPLPLVGRVAATARNHIQLPGQLPIACVSRADKLAISADYNDRLASLRAAAGGQL